MEKVIILLSTYNGEKYIKAQLDSLKKQENVDTCLLVRDDGSKDRTLDILNEWNKKYPDWIFVIKGENVGFAMSFTKLIQIAIQQCPNANYFAFCDQDDVWLPNKLYKAILKLKEKNTEDIPITYCSNTKLVDENLNFIGMFWKEKDIRLTKERALIQNFATGCTMVFNQKAAELYISHLPDEIRVHDFLMYKICIFFGDVIFDHNSYILYRQHGNNQIGKPGFYKRWRNRFRFNFKKNILEKQNYYFLQAFKDLLSVDDIALLSQIVFYRKNIFFRLSLLFDRKIKYTSFEANIFFILKIIKGYV